MHSSKFILLNVPAALAAELEKSGGALLLLLLAVNVEHGHVDVIEQLGVVLDGIARREEDDDLLLPILLEEGEEQHEAVLRLADDEALLERRDGRRLGLLLRPSLVELRRCHARVSPELRARRRGAGEPASG